MQLFYTPELQKDSGSFAFDREESRHIIKVLRKNPGDEILVTNGLGMLFTTIIDVASDHKCIVKVKGIEYAKPRPFRLHLAVAPTKMNDRYEWFLEKATEIGVEAVTPLICDRSERKIVKNDRFAKILVSAMKQSQQTFLPQLNEAVSFADFMGSKPTGQRFIAHCDDSFRKSLKQSLLTGADVTLLIGPEGDFSEKEIALALQNEYLPVSLGDTRLRTETAAVVACHSVAFANEQPSLS